VSGANTAGQVELATGRAVMAMGGFTGSDEAPTLAGLKGLIASGDLRFVVAGGQGGGPGLSSASSSISDWVTLACVPVSVDGTTTSVYDCAGAAG
jgi:hypothetical protein